MVKPDRTSSGQPPQGDADAVLRELLCHVPPDHLVISDPAREISARNATDVGWLREQIRLRGLIWGIDDPLVLGTLWWYSASNWLVMPTVTSWFVVGRALSADLNDLHLFHRPDSRIPGARSTQLGPPTIDAMGRQVRATLSAVIEPLAALLGKGERRLWAFAVDAIVGRILWAAEHTGRVPDVEPAAAAFVSAVGADLPAPRVFRLSTTEEQGMRVGVRRSSCCLLYRVPGEGKCRNCPRQPPNERLSRMSATP